MRSGDTLVTSPMWQKSPSPSEKRAGVTGFHLNTAMPGRRSAADAIVPERARYLRKMVLLPW